MREQARVDPGPNRDHSIRRAWVSRNDEPVRTNVTTARPVRATMPLDGRLARDPMGGLDRRCTGGLSALAPVRWRPTARCPSSPRRAASLLLGWSFEPLPTLGIAVAVGWWLWAVRRVNTVHPANPVPRRRTVAFLGGMTALAFALVSGIARYDTSLFSVHMVQHVLLMLVAAPLLALRHRSRWSFD